MKKIPFILALVLLFADAGFCCTIVSCSRNGKVFAAANEDDYISTLYSRIWFNPPTKERYGTVCFGLPDLQAQAIMNEYGLYVDFTAQNGIDAAKFNLKHPYYGDLFFEILGKCKTVKEALVFLQTHDYTYGSQALLADAQGHSVIINAGTKVMKEGSYQINTNFNISDLKKGGADRRYNIANSILSKPSDLSVAYFKTLLDRTHQEGDLTTIYSYVFDMQKGLIYVYFFHNFNNVYVVDIKKELKKGYRLENLGDHFPSSYAYETQIQKDPGHQKEEILSAVYKNGLDVTVDQELATVNAPAPKDSTLKMTMLEVALQLVKDSWNQHAQGGMWEYWFSLPGGYKIVHFRDKRLDAADRIFQSLEKQEKLDPKLKNFMKEIDAYVNLVQGDTAKARNLYELASADQKDTYPVSYNRAKEMLTKMD
ncbi:MAG TPA: hypothetical protein VK668_07040 [Mucilaginibacter sp.]|nr:hypothetical protein [Mucilaginibacter sp.]